MRYFSGRQNRNTISFKRVQLLQLIAKRILEPVTVEIDRQVPQGVFPSFGVALTAFLAAVDDVLGGVDFLSSLATSGKT